MKKGQKIGEDGISNNENMKVNNYSIKKTFELLTKDLKYSKEKALKYLRLTESEYNERIKNI